MGFRVEGLGFSGLGFRLRSDDLAIRFLEKGR